MPEKGAVRVQLQPDPPYTGMSENPGYTVQGVRDLNPKP